MAVRIVVAEFTKQENEKFNRDGVVVEVDQLSQELSDAINTVIESVPNGHYIQFSYRTAETQEELYGSKL